MSATIDFLSATQAAQALHRGEVIAYPTEAVYGLGCDPFNAQAMARIWQLKQRPASMGVILIAGEFAMLQPFMADISVDDMAQLHDSWPGAMTWVVPARAGTPDWLTGGRDTIALRWSSHPDVMSLCAAFGGALVSTSANRHGYAPSKDATDIAREFGGQAGFAGIMKGTLGGQEKPTPIRELTTGIWIRQA
jgi:L-threonylcarbamoyladenylate synthase